MSKISIGVCLFIFFVACGDNNTQEKTQRTAKVIQGENTTTVAIDKLKMDSLLIPESVAVHNGGIYTANIGGSPSASPLKGFITQLQKGRSTNLFLGLLDDPKGFGFLDNDTIIVSDHPNVKILKISTGEVIFTMPIKNPGFLNDLVMIDEQTGLLTDTGKGLIYKLSVSDDFTSVSYSIVNGIKENGINGIVYNSSTKKVYFVTSTFGGDSSRGHIFELTSSNNFDSVTVTQWNLPQQGAGGLDGVAFYKNYLVISDWGVNGEENTSKIFGYDLNSRSLAFTIEGELTSIADITINKGKIYLPEFLKHEVSVIDLSKAIK